jgi:vacuolar-type H+-ATPase subunit E/Vma4
MPSESASNTLQKVVDEFEGEALAGLQEGRASAGAALEAVRKETEASVSKILENGAKQAEALKRQIIGAAELESRNAQLRSLEAAVNESISAAMSKVSDLPAAEYAKSLERLISEAADIIGNGSVVSCSPEERRSVEAALKKLGKAGASLKMGEPLDTGSRGVVLTSADGAMRFDNTFAARLERMRAGLRKDVVAQLSG